MTTRIKGTNAGMFSGHILLGSILVSNKMDEIGLDENIKNKVLHMMISHHGENEKGSLKEPMFPEAVALYHADETSTRIAEMVNFIEEKKEETEDDFMPKWEKNKPTNVFLR
jgi:3'-5' exoribonuclease